MYGNMTKGGKQEVKVKGQVELGNSQNKGLGLDMAIWVSLYGSRRIGDLGSRIHRDCDLR